MSGGMSAAGRESWRAGTLAPLPPSTPVDVSSLITSDDVEAYRRDGVVRVKGVLSKERAEAYRAAADEARRRLIDINGTGMFTQVLQVWQFDEKMRELTFDPTLASLAAELSGEPMRLWHDHMLIKEPHNERATEFHQDGPLWSYDGAERALSAWVALVDVPVERGCMTFIPGSHHRTDLRPINLADEVDLFTAAPELQWDKRVTIPLQAGDCTFHNAFTGHMATPNRTDDPRFAHVVVYAPKAATFNGRRHIVTDPLSLSVGQTLPDDAFPPFLA
jgi:ectoine hydroxylase-related dioxygenase (phytanoyl-CoA dioxygenase family)